jgi:hypothetical protein
MFGFGKQEPSAKLPARFNMPLKRKRPDGGQLELNVVVSGEFTGSGGRPVFTIKKASVDGLPDLVLLPVERAEIEKYAVEIQYKKLLGK